MKKQPQMGTGEHGCDFLEKLLDGAEVEWVALGEVVKIKNGKDWKHLNSGDVPVYGSGGVMGYVDKFSCNKPTVLIPRKGSITNLFYVESQIWNVDTIYYTDIDTEILTPKFFYHFMKTVDLMSLDTGSGRPSLTQTILNKIPIPIPCPANPEKSLAIQAEIVRILDTFTELIAELATELTARKKQYNYYRDQLLTFEEGDVEWKTLGEVCGFKNGFAFKSSLFKPDGSPIIRITNVDGKSINLSDVKYFQESDYKQDLSSYEVSKGDLLVAMSGATTGKIGYYPHDEIAYLNQRVGKFLPKPEAVLNRYLYHYLLSKSDQMYVLAGGGAQPNLSSKALMEKLRVPIPYPNDPKKSLTEQARIVAILDKFDKLTHSISEGLPREIELRQKQYEYYRNLLLNFPKTEPQTETVA